MRYADIKKASEGERQNQTTTTNNKYIKKLKNLCPFKKKLNNKVKIASDETEKNKQTCSSPEKMVIHQFIIKLGND